MPAGALRAPGGAEPDALPGASAISGALGGAFLLLVWFGPRGASEPRLLAEPPPSEVSVSVAPDPAPPPPVAPPSVAPRELPPAVATRPPVRSAAPPAPRTREEVRSTPPPAADAAGAFGDAFAGPAPAADVRSVLSRATVAGETSPAAAASAGSKASLGEPAGAAAARSPGRATSVAGAAAIGVVGEGATVSRAAVRVDAPRPLGSAAGSGAGGGGSGGRDVAALGVAARSRESQLRFCYVDAGLRADPGLAGRVTVAVTLAATGAVNEATIAGRSWSGAGGRAAERCILDKVRGWQFPAGGEGRFAFSFSFTR